MRDLDETDFEILQLLLADSRRPYSEIADHVGLSPPAVSDRIDRLTEQGIVRRFTVDVDRTKLGHRTPVMIRLDVSPSAVERIFEQVLELKGVEHAFQQFDGTVLVHANAPTVDVNDWLRSSLDLAAIREYDVALLANDESTVDVSTAGFALTCAVCDNEVTDEGSTTRVDGDIKAFCCPTCESQYTEQYQRHRSEVD